MSRACENCLRRPSGIEGHEDMQLFDGRSPDGRQLFRCGRCGTLWTRSYEGSGTFVWILVDAAGA